MRNANLVRLLVLCAVCLPVVGCGGDSGGGSTAAPSPTATGVTIAGTTDMLKVREAVTFSATATLSSGSNAAVTNWTSDAARVAVLASACTFGWRIISHAD